MTARHECDDVDRPNEKIKNVQLSKKKKRKEKSNVTKYNQEKKTAFCLGIWVPKQKAGHVDTAVETVFSNHF